MAGRNSMTREEYNAYMREWHKKNRERINEERRAQHAADPEKKRTYMREWVAKNKSKKATHDHKNYKKNSEKIKARSAAWYAKNYERRKATSRAYYERIKEHWAEYARLKRLADPEAYKLKKRLDYERHTQAYKDRAKQWREVNPERATANRSTWKEANWGLVLAHCAAQRAHKLQRTPAWADYDAIEEVYVLCPEGYHVDHIYPLRGKLVSGLHVHQNLRVILATENLRKSNKMPEECGV